MKKIIVILTAILALSVCANAQRQSVTYLSGGVITRISDWTNLYPGATLAVGFRNYNQDAFVSFTYGAEAMAYWVPENGSNIFGAFAIPALGVAIGPRGFKFLPHAGFMAGYGSYGGSPFQIGSKFGVTFDIGNHISLDFSNYYTRINPWMSAINFIYRF